MAPRTHSKILKHYLFGLTVTSAFFFAVYVMFPTLRTHMVASNEILDMATAIVFVVAFATGLYYSQFVSPQRYRNLYRMLPCLAFIGFFSEVRLGLHPFVQQELFRYGIHNWVQLITIVFILVAVVSIVLIRYYRRFKDFPEWLQCNIPMIAFLTGFVLLFLASLWIDHNNIWGKRSIVFVEELCELDMAVSLLFCMVYLRSIVRIDRARPFSTSIILT